MNNQFFITSPTQLEVILCHKKKSFSKTRYPSRRNFDETKTIMKTNKNLLMVVNVD